MIFSAPRLGSSNDLTYPARGSRRERRLSAGTVRNALVLVLLVAVRSAAAAPSPAAIASTVSAGDDHTCVVTSTGGVMCWGSNFVGQLGDGTTIDRRTPVHVLGLTDAVSKVATAASHTCAVTIGGGVLCWGANDDGQLGDGTRIGRRNPVAVVGLSTGVVDIAAGFRHTCAITDAGGVKCWGTDMAGLRSTAPTDVIGLTGISALALGRFHTCALTQTGAVKCWGDNSSGELGDGTTQRRSNPVDVIGLSSGVAAITAGRWHTCALTAAAGVRCWGFNSYGQLGDGTRDNIRLTPVDVLNLTSGAVAVDAGLDHTCAVSDVGAVSCWGSNHQGQFGDGSTEDNSTPCEVPGLASGLVAVSAGSGHGCALTHAGEVTCWGSNTTGQLGDGAFTDRSGPVDVRLVEVFRRYLAEGATSDFFDTHLALFNPGPADAVATLTFMRAHGTPIVQQVAVPSHRRVTVDPKLIPDLAVAEFSTAIESDTVLVVDRTMSWGTAGGSGAHTETAVPSALAWYFAEGATHGGFNLFYLLANPNPVEAQVKGSFLVGGDDRSVLEKTCWLPPYSRTNIWVDVADDERCRSFPTTPYSADVGAVFRANSQPIVVERAMYLDSPGDFFAAGHAAAGVSEPAVEWYLAEGATGSFFDMFILITNERDDAEIEAKYMLPDGTSLMRTYVVPGRSRFTIWVNHEDPRLSDTAVSTLIRSTNGTPIVVDRSMWWPGPTAATWFEGHASAGATTTGVEWAFADGASGGISAAETYILVANTSDFAGQAIVTLFFEDGATAARAFSLRPSSRSTIAVDEAFPEAAGTRFAAIVASNSVPYLDGPPGTPFSHRRAQIVVERSMYWDALGQKWAAGTNALATRLQ